LYSSKLTSSCHTLLWSTAFLSAVLLLQMRNHPHVQSDDQLKEMLLDAYARRCLQQSQQPLYHMQPLGERWPHAATAAAAYAAPTPQNVDGDVAGAPAAGAGQGVQPVNAVRAQMLERIGRVGEDAMLIERQRFEQFRQQLDQQRQLMRQQPNQGPVGEDLWQEYEQFRQQQPQQPNQEA
jgi:hypothetical protein